MHKMDTKLLLAAKSNDLTNLYKILSRIDKAKIKGKSKDYVDFNTKDSDGLTALHYAAKHGNIEMLETLLFRGAIIDVTDKAGWRPLSYASANNQLQAVSMLIDRGSRLHTDDEDNSPIHIAAKIGHVDIVKILMEKGDNSHSQNKLQQTPVDIACENNHYGVVNVLLSASSKLIEDFSENSFKSIARKSLNSPITKTSTLPLAMSNNNIRDNIASSWANNFPDEQKMKCYSNGSQEQISSSDRYNFHSFKSCPAKKSESLNAIFLQDEVAGNGEMSEDGCTRRSFKYNTLNKTTKDGPLEIILPYPSKYSTCDVLRIKSPLLPMKSTQAKDMNYSSKRIQRQMSLDDKVVNLSVGLDERVMTSGDINYQRDESEQNFKFRKNRHRFQSSRSSNKMSRSSLPVQSHYQAIPGSPTQIQSQQFHYRNHSVNGKPPAIKFKEKRDITTDSGSVKNQENWKQCINGNSSPSVITGICVDNDGFSCHKWIKSIELLMIWDSLVKEGFDSFLALSLANDEELLILCNNRIDYLDKLKTQLGFLNIPTIEQLTFSSDIQQILTQLGLEEYGPSFIHHGYFFVGHLPKISEKLLNELGILKLGHRRLIYDCIKSLLLVYPPTRHKTATNRSVSSLSQEINNNMPCSPVDLVPFKDIRTKCHSLPRFTVYGTESMKRSPPPIPPRSCSIPMEECSKNFTLDDILTESMCQSNISPKKKDYYASSDFAGDLANLDDLVNMLTSLGNDLDCELKQCG